MSRFSFKDTDDSQDGRGDHRLFLSTTFTRSQTFRFFFATLHVRWLSRIFNRTACKYQNATRWDLPPNWNTIWLIDEKMLISVCLHDDFLLGFLLQQIDIGNRWIWTCIGYYPYITSEPTNQMRLSLLLLLLFFLLNHIQSMFHFYTPWKQQKTGGSLKFSVGIKVEHWLKMF